VENTIVIKNASVLLDGIFETADLLLQGGIIADISKHISPSRDAQVIDAKGAFMLPGFIDVHTHGGAGIDVVFADQSEFAALSDFFASKGTTSWLASLVADTEEGFCRSIDGIRAYMDGDKVSGAHLLGVHLEGPFLEPAYKGIMAEDLLSEGDMDLFEHLQSRCGDALRYITVSPEVPGIFEMIGPMTKSGVVVSLGHTGADYDLSMRTIESGATSITHIFNALRLFHQHEPAIMGAALESDVYCEAICDGFHLHPATVRLLLKTKGYDRVVAITDSNMAAGMPDGRYRVSDIDIVVEDGDAKTVATGGRAGSTLTMIKALQNLKKFTGQPINKLSPLLSTNPAAMLGIDHRKGHIAKGFDADLVLIGEDDEVAMTIVAGRIAYDSHKLDQ